MKAQSISRQTAAVTTNVQRFTTLAIVTLAGSEKLNGSRSEQSVRQTPFPTSCPLTLEKIGREQESEETTVAKFTRVSR